MTKLGNGGVGLSFILNSVFAYSSYINLICASCEMLHILQFNPTQIVTNKCTVTIIC